MERFQLRFAGVSRCLSSEVQKMFLAAWDVFTSAGASDSLWVGKELNRIKFEVNFAKNIISSALL